MKSKNIFCRRSQNLVNPKWQTLWQRKIICSIIIILTCTFLSFNLTIAQQIPDSLKSKNKTALQTIGNDFSDSFKDGIKVYSSPFHFNSKEWITSGALILTASAFYLKDESLRAYSKKNHSDINDKIYDAGTIYGNLITPGVIGGSIYIYGLTFKDDYTRVTGRMVFESVLYAGLITTVLKSVSGRYRPYTNAGSNFFRPFQVDEGRLSFPSGHSTVAFAISSVLSNRINNTYASIGLYTLAGVTAISRVYKDDHWASDVIIGSAIGYFVGDFISSKKELNSGSKLHYNIFPGINNINLLISF